MAYAAFSPENRMQEFLRDENATTLFIATLASLRGVRGLSQSRLSAVVRGRGLEHDAAKALCELMSQLERLRDAVAPIPVSYFHAGVINDLLNRIERGQLLVVASANSGEEATDNSADNPLVERSGIQTGRDDNDRRSSS